MYSSRRTAYLASSGGIAVLLVLIISVMGGIGGIGGIGRTVNKAFAAPHAQAAANTAVTTYKNDNSRTGNQNAETTLTTSNVNQNTFGKRVVYPTDGQMYAQPLYLPNVTIGGTIHNVVYVATEHDSVYAFDADQTSTTAPLWSDSFLSPPSVVAPSNLDVSCNDLLPENGISGTPVIDSSTGTLYVVAMTKENGTLVYRLHALDTTTGNEKPGSPTLIQASLAGTGYDSVNGQVSFQPLTERQRASLVLSNGAIYIAWASFCDNDPYHGWIMSYSYNGTQFQQVNVYNNTVNARRGGIWGAGGAISADGNGNIYYVSGNGTFDANTGGVDYGDSFVKLNAQLQVQDYFTPFNQQCLDAEDADLGSGGPLLVPGLNEIISAGKEGRIYVINSANMGHYTTITNPCSNQSLTTVDKIVQELPVSTIGGLYSNSTYWKSASGQQFIYFSGANDSGKAFVLNSNGTLASTPASRTPETFGFTGGNPTVSSNSGAAGSGILWTLDRTPALRAFDATDLSKELYNSTQNSPRDGLESYVKFSAPTVANGEVFVGTGSSLDIFGLLPMLSGTPTPTPIPNGYNNIGISDDHARSIGNYDGAFHSYSAQALQSARIFAGGSIHANGFTFIWPNVASGAYDNYQAQGQTLAVAPVASADHLGLLGASTNGAASGTATITYTDGSTQTFTLALTDWATPTVSFGNSVVATMPYLNTKTGKRVLNTFLFSASVALQAGKTIQSVTLPTTITGGQMHIFALGTSSSLAPAYNNVGISDDINVGTGNYDGAINSYSAQALQSVGITPGSTVSAGGFAFTWPDVASGTYDNYQAKGQTLAVTPVASADQLGLLGASTNGAASGTATITYTDGSTQTFTLGLTDWATSTVSFGNTVATTIPYLNTKTGKRVLNTFLFSASVALQAGKNIQSVTLPTAISGGQMHIFALGTSSSLVPTYNNVGISDDNNVMLGNYDGAINSYSTQALQSVGIIPGSTITVNGSTFTWPNVASGLYDNYQAQGQKLAVTPVASADHLSLLGASTNGAASGTATITYTDGSTQTFTLALTDWATPTVSFGNSIAATVPYLNTKTGKRVLNTFLFSASVALQAGKTIQSVTLPTAITGGQMHIFALTTSSLTAPIYNNVGITNDGNVYPGNYDGSGSSYSAQALQSVGLNAGDNAFDPTRTVVFTWPGVPAGTPENYQTSGQVIPVTSVPNASILAFLGSATNGPTSGTATITYTDGSTQTFTLGFSDWTLDGGKSTPAFGNTISYASPYRSNPHATNGKEAVKTYVFYASVALQSGKSVASVTLPQTLNQGHLHVFAITTK